MNSCVNLPCFTPDFNEKCLKILVNQEFIAYASAEMTQMWFNMLLEQLPSVVWLEVFDAYMLLAIWFHVGTEIGTWWHSGC